MGFGIAEGHAEKALDSQVLSGIKILHIHTLPVISGSGINTLLTMRGSRDAGAEVALACAPGGRLQSEVEKEGMTFLPIKSFVQPVSPLQDLRALWALFRTIRRGRFDIVHTHNSKAGFLGRLAASLARTPVIIHTVHGFAFHEQEKWLSRRLFLLAEKMAEPWCDRMIVISQPLLDWAVTAKIARPEKMRRVYSGIDIADFREARVRPEIARDLGIRPGETVVGIVSKLWAGKGHELLLRAVATLIREGRRMRLLVVGEGDQESVLRQETKALGLDAVVVFTGFRSDIPEITALLDIAVLPSLFEGMGRVVLEAMAAGKPVVASRVGGIPELVLDGVTGFLFPPGDLTALTDRLRTLVDDADLRGRLGAAAGRHVDERFSSDRMVSEIHQVYEAEMARLGSSSFRRQAIA